MSPLRILFLADTHLGFDLPFKPRVNRRRRGVDFFRNYDLALQPAFKKDVDIVIHGGDLFYRSRIPEILISMAFEPLIKIADSGIPIVLVAGNHERSFIKQTIFEKHKNIYIFNEFKAFCFQIRNLLIQISGFPCVRKNIRSEFLTILKKIDYKFIGCSHVHILCMHQAIEGAQVGVQNYTFQSNSDTIRAMDIPENFSAILSGHIHRRQVLTHGLDGKKMKTNVYYPGSIERTSFAERDEPKGILFFDLMPSETGGTVNNYKFMDLPTRPMKKLFIDANNLEKNEIIKKIAQNISTLDSNSIVQLKILKENISHRINLPKIDEIRRLIPSSINISYKVE